MKKLIPSLIFTIFLLQGCVAYQNVPISLNDAQDQGKAKAVSKHGRTMLFKNIIVEDSLYYGVTKTFNMPLDSTVTIYLKDVGKSRNLTIIGIASIPVLFIVADLIYLASTGYFN